MREFQPAEGKVLAAKTDARLSIFAAYAALLVIAGIVFGTLPFRPF